MKKNNECKLFLGKSIHEINLFTMKSVRGWKIFSKLRNIWDDECSVAVTEVAESRGTNILVNYHNKCWYVGVRIRFRQREEGREGDRTRPGQFYPEIWKQETGWESQLVSLRLGRSVEDFRISITMFGVLIAMPMPSVSREGGRVWYPILSSRLSFRGILSWQIGELAPSSYSSTGVNLNIL